MPVLPSGPAISALSPPSDAVAGGRAIVTTLPLGQTGRTVVAQAYVKSVLLSTLATGFNDVQGRPLYSCGDLFNQGGTVSDQTSGIGMSIAMDALFLESPYTYRYLVVDGGGKFECQYYSAVSTDFGLPDYNGNYQQRTFDNFRSAFVLRIPSDAAKSRYPSLSGSKGVYMDDSSLTGSDYVVLGKSTDRLAPDGLPRSRKGGGVCIGMLYNPGGNDPALSNMHWIQIVGTTSPTGAHFFAADDGSTDLLPKTKAANGKNIFWFLDNNNQTATVNYDNRPVSVVSNTAFWIDLPFQLVPPTRDVINGLSTPVQVNPQMTALETPGDLNKTYHLFKMWYTDPISGLPVPNAMISASNILSFTIARQGIQYGYTLTNYI